jgi:hypothetical protein
MIAVLSIMFSIRPIESAVRINICIELAILKLLKKNGLTAEAMLHFQQNDGLSADQTRMAVKWVAAASALCMKPDESLVLPIPDENVAGTSVIHSEKRI